MYGKIFESMYDGSLYGQWEAIITMQQMIVLADKEGVVDITPPALAARTSIPLEIIEKGIGILESEDPYSRTEGDDGKRIKLIDDHRPWGWQIVNYGYYRDLASVEDKREKARIRKQKQREREKESQGSHTSSRSSRHTDTDINTDTDKKDHAKACSFEDKMKEYFDGAIDSCKKLQSLTNFNPYQWIQYQINQDMHPGAILETLQALRIGSDVKQPWAYANKIIATKNGNWHEKDHISKHEDVKKEFNIFIKDQDLSKYLDGIIKPIKGKK